MKEVAGGERASRLSIPVQLISGRRPAASMDDLVRGRAAVRHVSGRLVGISDRDGADGPEPVGHTERVSYCVDPVDGDAEEQAPSPSFTAVSRISREAKPVSMSQYGAGHQASAGSTKPLSASA